MFQKNSLSRQAFREQLKYRSFKAHIHKVLLVPFTRILDGAQSFNWLAKTVINYPQNLIPILFSSVPIQSTYRVANMWVCKGLFIHWARTFLAFLTIPAIHHFTTIVNKLVFPIPTLNVYVMHAWPSMLPDTLQQNREAPKHIEDARQFKYQINLLSPTRFICLLWSFGLISYPFSSSVDILLLGGLSKEKWVYLFSWEKLSISPFSLFCHWLRPHTDKKPPRDKRPKVSYLFRPTITCHFVVTSFG